MTTLLFIKHGRQFKLGRSTAVGTNGLDRLDDVHTLEDLTENHMTAIQPLGLHLLLNEHGGNTVVMKN